MDRIEPRWPEGVAPPPNPDPVVEELDRAYLLAERRGRKNVKLIDALRGVRNVALSVEMPPDRALLEVARIVDEALSEEFPP